MAQWEDPVKQDRSEQIKTDLEDLGIKPNLEEIEAKSKMSFKKMVKTKIMEFALDKLNLSKFKHSKMDNLLYTELKIQDYLVSEDISVKQKRILFQFRTRMSNFAENYRGPNPPVPCKICCMHVDSQNHAVNCVETMKNVKETGKYDDIFTTNIPAGTAVMIERILEFRENKLG